MVVKQLAVLAALAFTCGLTVPSLAQSPRVLNNFEDGGSEGWALNFGSGLFDVGTVFNNEGEFHELAFSVEGAGGAIRDNFNNTGALFQPGAGGVDLTGLSTIEMEIRYEGDVPTQNLQFYVQANTTSTYVGMNDVTLTAGVPEVISFDLSVLTPPQIAFVRVWGVNVRALPAEYEGPPLRFFIKEVRSTGTPLTERLYADFVAGGPDDGFHGVFMNFNGAAIVGNTGQDKTGFSRVEFTGTDGVLEYQQQYAEDGSAVPFGPAWSWQNGFNPGFNGRPTDATNYDFIEVDIALENTSGTSLDVAYFTQSTTFDEDGFKLQDFQYYNHDFATITANTGFQTLVFELDKDNPTMANVSHIMRHGLNFGATVPDEIYTIRVDEIRATTVGVPPSGSADGFAIY